MSRLTIDRTTDHSCVKMESDIAYFASQGRPARECVNCNVAIPQHFAQCALLCADCRRECLDDNDAELENCVYCGVTL